MEILDNITNVLGKVSDFVWGIPLIVLILATGLLLTIRLKGIQITKLPLAIKNLVRNERSGDTGEVSSFGALCTALSATIGTGNIVGVATAIAAGGPGALFWMWMAALVGTATKYSECLLAVKYRQKQVILSEVRSTILKKVWAKSGNGWQSFLLFSALWLVCSASVPLPRLTASPVQQRTSSIRTTSIW